MAERLRGWTVPLISLLAVSLGINAFQWMGSRRDADGVRGPTIVATHLAGTRNKPLVVIDFDAPMVAATALDTTLAAGRVALDPPVPLTARFLTPRRLELKLERRLARFARYRVRFAPTFADAEGRPLANTSAPEAQLASGRLALTDAPSTWLGDTREIHIDLEFNGHVGKGRLAKHLRLEAPDGTPIPFLLSGSKDEYVLQLESLPINGAQLTLTQGLSPTSGTEGLARDVKHALTWPTTVRITDVRIRGDHPNRRIELRFSHQLAETGLAEFVTVEPRPEDLQISRRGPRLILRGRFPARRTVDVRLKRGLPTAHGVRLEADAVRHVQVPAPDARLSFAQGGRVLSRAAKPELEIEGVGVGHVVATVEEVYPNNIVPLALRWEQAARLSMPAHTARLDVDLAADGRLHHTLDLAQLLGKRPGGVYRVTIEDPERPWISDARLLQVTDLAPVVRHGPDGIVVLVSRLSDGGLVAGAQVTVFDAQNQPCAQGVTDATGLFVEPNPTGRARIVTLRTDTDTAFVDLRAHRFAHVAKQVEGRAPARSLEAFAYTDRGVVRPGEICHGGVLVRTLAAEAAPAGLPLTLRLTGPDGRTVRTQQRPLGAQGMLAFDLPFAQDAPTGAYALEVLIAGKDKPIGAVRFRVDTVVPDRIEPHLTVPTNALQLGAETHVEMGARLLAGDPAPGRKATLRVHYVPVASATRPGFTFGDPAIRPEPFSETLGSATLDTEGRARLPVTLAGKAPGGYALRATFELEVVDLSGRAAFVRQAHVLTNPAPRLGLALPQDQGHALALALQGAHQTTGTATLERLVWRGGFVFERGRRVWRSERVATQIEQVAFAIEDGVGSATFADRSNGTFRVRVEAPNCAPAARTYGRHDGKTATATRTQGAPALTLHFDAAFAVPGKAIQVEVQAPFAGRGLLCIEGPGTLEARSVQVVEGHQAFTLTLPESRAANIHVSLTLLRGLREAGDVAIRRVGVVAIPLRRPEAVLQVDLDLPAQARPGSRIAVRVTTSTPAMVRLHLVDEGVLRLTGHPSPDPTAHFLASRALEVQPADLYTRLLEGMRFGSDDPNPGGGGALARRLDPTAKKTILTVALASALVAVDGEHTFTFALPGQYEGRLRVFAVAAGLAGTGSASAPLVLKAPISVALYVPRAVAPGDTFELPLVVKGDGVNFEVAVEGALLLQNQPTPDGARLRLRAGTSPGVAAITITAQDARGNTTTRRRAFQIRPAAAYTVSHDVYQIAAGETLDSALPGAFLRGHRRARLLISGTRGLELLPAMERLLDYPHGCVEQTTSRAFPILGWSELARLATPDGGRPRDVVGACVDRLLSMQLSSGALAYWPGGSTAARFGSTYGAHFLVEAKQAGRRVTAKSLDDLLAYLMKRLRAGEATPYTAYVLALAKQPVRPFLEGQLDRAKGVEQHAHLAAAFQLVGETSRAQEILSGAGDPWAVPRAAGADLASPLRAAATTLRTLQAVAPGDARIALLAERLRAAAARPQMTTTQENAAILLALAAHEAARQAAPAAGTLTLHGEAHPFDANHPLDLAVGRDEPWRFQLTAHSATTLVIRVEGIPSKAPAADIAQGLSIRRKIVAPDGPLKQGRVYEVIIEGVAPKGAANLLITDLLPGGLEIEAARDRAGSFKPDRVELRDDRVLFFRSDPLTGAFRQTYLVRAVTLGEFQVPAIAAELLYDPTVRARTGGRDKVRIVR